MSVREMCGQGFPSLPYPVSMITAHPLQWTHAPMPVANLDVFDVRLPFLFVKELGVGGGSAGRCEGGAALARYPPVIAFPPRAHPTSEAIPGMSSAIQTTTKIIHQRASCREFAAGCMHPGPDCWALRRAGSPRTAPTPAVALHIAACSAMLYRNVLK